MVEADKGDSAGSAQDRVRRPSSSNNSMDPAQNAACHASPAADEPMVAMELEVPESATPAGEGASGGARLLPITVLSESLNEEQPNRYTALIRVGAVLLLLLLVWSISTAFGVQDQLSLGKLRNSLQSLSAENPVLSITAFVVAFSVGELVHVPGVIFIFVAALSFGRWLGAAAAYGGSLVSISFSFVVVRLVGGQPMSLITSARVRMLMDRVERRPIASIAVLRLLFWLTPALNYVLAFSSVRFVDYLAGSALGLFTPVTGVALLFDWLLPQLERHGWIGEGR